MELELKDYLIILRKRLWLIIGFVTLSCLAAALISMYLLQPVYEASTKLIVNQSNENVGMQQLDLNAVNLNLRLIDTYKEIIKTPAVMNAVMVENPEFGLTANELIQKVRVSSVNNTQVMTLVVEDESYDRAAAIVNAVSVVFQREIPKIMNVDNVSILNEAPANDNPIPVKPNKTLNVAIAFVVSLMIILGIVLLLEYFDDTVKTEKDVESLLGLPTLTVVARTSDEDFQVNGLKHSNRKVTDNRAALEQ
jgi:capsular polysaccharide biosynthesis protein